MTEFRDAVGVDAASSRGRSDAYGAQVQILREQYKIIVIVRLGERVALPRAELLEAERGSHGTRVAEIRRV